MSAVLTKFGLENFKSFLTRQEIPLAPITLLYGPNGGGKSSVIQALMLMRQTLESGSPFLETNGPDVALGSAEALLSLHDTHRAVVMSLDFANGLPWPEENHQHFEMRYEMGRPLADRCGLSHIRFNCTGGDKALDLRVSAIERSAIELNGSTRDPWLTNPLGRPHRVAYRFESPDWFQQFCRFLGIDPHSHEPDQTAQGIIDECVRNYYLAPNDLGLPFALRDPLTWGWVRTGKLGDPFDELAQLGMGVEGSPRPIQTPRTLSHLAFTFAIMGRQIIDEAFSSTLQVHPAREVPQRIYAVDPYEYAAESRWHRLSDWAAYLYGNPRAVKVCNEALDRLEIGYKLELGPVAGVGLDDRFQVLLVDTSSGARVTMADVGFGVSQVLPIVVAAIRSSNAQICVQQPELHLHPRLQGGLADLLIDSSCNGIQWGSRQDGRPSSAPNRWLVETHSEAIMTRIQRRIREGKIPPDHVSVLYVGKIRGVGSVVTPLRLDQSGNFIDEWPGGFFEEGFDDFFGGLS